MRLYELLDKRFVRPYAKEAGRNPEVGTIGLVTCQSINVSYEYDIPVYRTCEVIAVQKTGWKVKVTGEEKPIRFGSYGCEIGGRRHLYIFKDQDTIRDVLNELRQSENVPLVIDATSDKTESFRRMAVKLAGISTLMDSVFVGSQSNRKSRHEKNEYLESLSRDQPELNRVYAMYEEFQKIARKSPKDE